MNDLILLSEALLAEGIGAGMECSESNRNSFPKELGFLRLALVGSGLVLLLLSLLSGTPVYDHFALFVLGAGGGFTLIFTFHARNRILPVSLIVAHGGLVAIAWVWLMLRYLIFI